MQATTAVTEWTPIWAMPNVMIDEPIEASQVALMNCRDQRVRELAHRHPAFQKFLGRFRDEFGSRVWPTILLIRSKSSEAVRTVAAISGFRDAICISAVASSHARIIRFRRPAGRPFSDAFDVYPWFLGRDYDTHLYAMTPAMHGMHSVDQLRAQTAPALSSRDLRVSDLDQVLLSGLLLRWDTHFAQGIDAPEHRRLFRALDMVRAASRMPGSVDGTHHDGGRAVALWVSAFEILVHDGHADIGRVIGLLNRVHWERRELKARDRMVVSGRNRLETNIAGEIYASLNRVRNDYMHGNPVTSESLILARCDQHVLRFAAPLFRMALTAYLSLYPTNESPDAYSDSEGFGKYVSDRMDFMAPQRLAEAALLVAEQKSESN